MRPADDPIRVMMVDDSAVARWIIQSVIDAEPDIKVVSTASNGEQALERIPVSDPDLVILDVEMPVMDGIETLKRIRRTFHELPVLMYSTLTQKSAATTLEALALGASDYVAKPHKEGGRDAALAAVHDQLVPKIRVLARPSSFARKAADERDVASAPLRSARRPARVDAIVVGASTGGPNALAEMIPHLPESLSAPVFVVQHMPPVFTQMLADRLDGRSPLRVVEASPGMRVRSGMVYIAPGGVHMVVRRHGTDVLVDADDGPPEHSVKPAVNVLFRRAVDVWGGNLIAVVLTGMGEDGLEGSRTIAAAGGMIIAQDAGTSLVWGMPGSVARAGLASEVVPLDEIAGLTSRLARGTSQRVAT